MPAPYRQLFGCLSWLLLSLALPGAARADEAARMRAVVTPVIDALMARHEIPGMAVGVALQGQPYLFHFGVADKASGQPVTDGTLFEIGSLSKPLTATLAAYAAVTGKLALSDTPGRHVPKLRGAPIDRATLLELGTYTAGGLPLQFPDAVADDKAALAYYAQWVPAAQPGTQRLYSNPSLGLFGLAASNALGQSFAGAMETLVFPAFGMARSFLHVPAHAAADYAWGYRGDQAVRVNPGPMDEQAYGVKTTASDLLRFVQGNIDPRALPAPMRQAVQLTHVAQFRAGPLVQGLGWEQYPYPTSRERLLGGNAAEMVLTPQPAQRIQADQEQGARLFNKTGSTGGFGAYALFVPTENIGIVLLANRNYPNSARIEAAWAILQGVVGKAP